MKVLITGAGGMLGHDLASAFAGKFEVCGAGRSEAKLPILYHKINLLDPAALKDLFNREKPSLVFHAAAYTNVDGCETDRKNAYAENVELTQLVTDASVAARASVVFFSTDYIFNGEKAGEYQEEDLPAPLNYYGETKLLAENYIRRNAAQYAIIRISWLYGYHGKSFPRTILERASGQKRFEVVADQTGRPTYTKDLADAMAGILKRDPAVFSKKNIYHLANNGTVNWADYARFILKKAGYHDADVVSITSEQASRPAKRPRNSVLSLKKASTELKVEMRSWQEAVTVFISEFQKEGSLT